MKLAIIIAAGSLAFATPVFACPGHDSADAKTAEKAPAKNDKGTADKAKEAPKTTETKDTAKTAAPAKDTAKKAPDKVSQK
jgi:hypothetical protein